MGQKLVFLCRGLMLASLLLAQPAAAQSNYPKPLYTIDIRIAECMAEKTAGNAVVLAYSDSEFSWCSFGAATVADLRADAVARCNGALRQVLRSLTPCVVVMENGKVTNSRTVSEHRRDARTPVQYEVFGGSTGETTVESGYLVSGKFINGSVQQIKLIRGKGRPPCAGTVNNRNLSFVIQCDDITLKGKPTAKGSFFYENRLRLAFMVTFKFNGGTFKVTTVTPKGAKIYPF